MSGKYMDFVPVRFKPAPEEVSDVKRPTKEEADFDISQVDDVEVTEILRVRTEEKVITSATAQDFSSRFLKTKVEKRPLGRMAPEMHADMPAEAATMTVADALEMAKNEEPEEVEEVEENIEETVPEEAPEVEIEVADEAEMSAKRHEKAEEKPKVEYTRFPKARFVNTDKVVQRPLSPSVHRPEPVATSEKSSGPVTIIEKPEKDSKAAIVVAIILTIILGAAAGTVAFLLLPK